MHKRLVVCHRVLQAYEGRVQFVESKRTLRCIGHYPDFLNLLGFAVQPYSIFSLLFRHIHVFLVSLCVLSPEK